MCRRVDVAARTAGNPGMPPPRQGPPGGMGAAPAYTTPAKRIVVSQACALYTIRMQQFPALWCVSADTPVQDTVDSVIAALPAWGHGPPGGRMVLVWDGRVDAGAEDGPYSSNAGLILLGPGPVLYPFPGPVALHLTGPTAAALWTAVIAVSQGYVVAGRDAGASMVGYRTGNEVEAEIALTSRELEVLELIAQGLPNKAVAHELGIGLGTVKFHLANLMGKLGVQNRAEAVMEAAREGLLKV